MRFITFLIVPLFIAVSINKASAVHSKELGWLVGKVVVVSNGTHDFRSTGFIYKHRSNDYVITAYHAIKAIQRDYGERVRISIKLPTIKMPLSLRLVFTEPLEDSAVFEIVDPFPGYVPESVYESSLSIKKGRPLKIIGYAEDIFRQHKPRSLLSNFLTVASLNFKTDRIALPPNLNKKDSAVVLARCDVPFFGMSGGPVLNADNNALVGMTKSFGNSTKNWKLYKRLDVEEFHVIVRLDKTIERIKNLP